jgi:hypothetical protein
MRYGSLQEDLALERVQLAELEADAARLWRMRQYKLAKQREGEAARARERVLELEERERQ